MNKNSALSSNLSPPLLLPHNELFLFINNQKYHYCLFPTIITLEHKLLLYWNISIEDRISHKAWL